MTRWRSAQAVVTGSDHVRFGIGCQDAALVRSLEGGAMLIAVSDGAGSASHPEIGAQTATEAAIAYLQDADTPDGLALIGAVQTALVREATRLSVPLAALSCTLITAKLEPDAAFFAQIGDGAIVYRDAHTDTLTLAFPPHKGEHANETRFVTAIDAATHVQTASLAPPTALALLTDGLERQALDLATHTPFAPFFEPLFHAVATLPDTPESEAELAAELAAFLGSPRVAEATGDDVTLVLCCR